MNDSFDSGDPSGDLSFVIPSEHDGERVDAALSSLSGWSRASIQDRIARGLIRHNGAVAKKSDRVVAGDTFLISADLKAEVVHPVASVDFAVIYSDDDIIVVDKPVGVAVHPAPGWDGPTVVGELARRGFQLPGIGVDERPGVVHRLDVGTSGVMVVAASDLAYRELKRAFHDREVDKVYHALVQGYPSPSSGTIDAPIGRHPSSSWKFAVVRDGRPSITHYDTLEVFPGATLVEVHLETGRTHQIRVHFQAERHPLVGDTLYGADPTFSHKLQLERQWLHAVSLSFQHPRSGKQVTFTSEYPEDLSRALRLLNPD